MKKNFIVVLIALSALFESVMASSNSDSVSAESINLIIKNSVQEMIASPIINGVSVGVYFNKNTYIEHFGELKKGSGVPPNDKTIYEIGSGSKTFAGAIVAKAVLEGKLKLDDDITQFLADGYENLAVDGSAITISHLLTHTAGLPNILPKELDEAIADFENPDTPKLMNGIIKAYNKKQYLEDLKNLKINTVPGAAYSYSSAGTELLAHILEQLYSQSYAVILSEFLAGLEMADTKITLSDADKHQLALGYHLNSVVTAPPMAELPWGASGSMKSTVPDILRYLEFQLDRSDPVSQASHKLLFTSKDRETKLAYQWSISNDPILGEYLIHHGGVFSAQNYMVVAPELDLGIFIVTNQSGVNTPADLNSALNALIEGIAAHTKEGRKANGNQ